jgi:uncharacterized protein (TIGR02145 family)
MKTMKQLFNAKPADNMQGIAGQARNDSSFHLKKKIFLPLLIAVMTMNLQAQVRIGKDTEPEKGTILDLNAKPVSGYVGGLLLPNVEITALKTIPSTFTDAGNITASELAGLTVYNVYSTCMGTICPGVYVWTGTQWDKIGEPCGFRYGNEENFAELPVPQNVIDNPAYAGKYPGGKIKFLTYNLGADPSLSPKQQMEYLAKGNINIADIKVYGGLFQWGRQDWEHSGRCPIAEMGRTTQYTYPEDINDNGLPKFDDGKFVWDSSFENWIATNTGAPNYSSTYGMFPAIWGNGLGLGGQTMANTNIQNLANPCPSGWRVPTQDEWEMLGNYNNNTATASATFSTSASGTTVASGLILVPVVNGKPGTGWSNSNLNNVGGYALYNSTDWTTVQTYLTQSSTHRLYDSDNTACPAPLLFLPAAGLRDYIDGQLINVGNYGYYWSSTVGVNRIDAFRLGFNSTDLTYNAGYIIRAIGQSVRCVAN